jgi:hypothetical protein
MRLGRDAKVVTRRKKKRKREENLFRRKELDLPRDFSARFYLKFTLDNEVDR